MKRFVRSLGPSLAKKAHAAHSAEASASQLVAISAVEPAFRSKQPAPCASRFMAAATTWKNSCANT